MSGDPRAIRPRTAMTRSPRPPVGPLADEPSEKAIVARGRDLLHQLGCSTYSLQQTRPSRQARGFPDLFVMSPRLGGFFWEAKAPGGRQSPAQVAFEQECQRCGVEYLCGDLDALLAYLERRGLIERAPA